MVAESSVNHAMNILELLDGVPFPANKQDLIAYAEANDASEEALDVIQGMSGDEYISVNDINRHLNSLDRLPGQQNLWSSAESADLPTEQDEEMTEMRGSGRV